MAFCANCGTKLTEGARFCPSCGTGAAPGPASPWEQAIEFYCDDDYEAAIQLCDECLKQNGEDAAFLGLRAMAQYQTGKVEEALAGFARAAELGRKLTSKEYYLWGCACSDAGDYTGTIERLNKAQEAGLDDFDGLDSLELFVKRAGAYAELKQYDLAEKDLASAREYTDEDGSPLYESYWVYYLAEAELHDGTGRYAEAVQSLDRALALIGEKGEGMEELRANLEAGRAGILAKIQSGSSAKAAGAKFCTSCGAALAPGAKFCAECGTRV